MTAPVTTSVPTPGDIARRQEARPTPPATRRPAPAPVPKQPYEPRKLTAEESIAPGQINRKKEHFRKCYRVGLTISRMPPHARLVGHDLMWRANHVSGQIGPNYQPSTEDLAEATGLTTGQVLVAIEVLRSRGWLYERRVHEGPRAGQSAMGLTIPAGVLEQVRARRGTPQRKP